MRYDIEELRRVPYFSQLDEATLAEVMQLAVHRRVGRGEVLFLEGERGDGLYLLMAGRVRIYKTSPEGREQTLATVGPGESFNEVPGFDGGPNPAGAEALADTEALLLRQRDLQSLIARSPAFSEAVIRTFASRLRQLATLIEDLSFKHVTARVAKILLKQADDPTARLTQQQMAAIAGTAREVVGRVLKTLEQDGVVKVERGRVAVLDRARLEELA